MIAVRVTGPIRLAIVGAPVYFARRSPPRTPDDLTRHGCVQYRLPGDRLLEWPLARDGKTCRVPVNGRVMVNDPHLAAARRSMAWALRSRSKLWPTVSALRATDPCA